MRPWCFVLLALVASGVTTRADYARDIARIHVEALGGREAIGRLQALRARGTLETPARTLEFDLIAQRPDRVHITTSGGGQTVIQASDGEHAPWRLRPQRSPVAQIIGGDEAVSFRAEAEFDDPLVNPDQRGYSLDYGGETNHRGRRAFRILVTHVRYAPQVLLVDAENYFVVARETVRLLPSGRSVAVETHFDNFMLTNGVAIPRLITRFEGGAQLQRTVIATVEPNPALDFRQFAVPGPSQPN